MKKSVYILTLLFIAHLGYAQIYTEVEPNNSFAQANMVTSTVTIIDSMGSSSDVDYFQVNLPSAGVLTVALSNVPSGQLMRLYAYNSAQGQIGFVQAASNGSGFTYDLLLPSGITYLRISDLNGLVSSSAFHLNLSLDNSDACECNNSFATACLVSPNSLLHPQLFGYNSDLGGNDVDYFELNLPDCGVVSINLSNIANNQLIRLYAYDAAQNQIGFIQAPSTGTGFSYDLLLPSGVSYFRIYDINGNSDSIHLNLSLVYDTSDACECNNSFATACQIPANDTIHPQLFGYNSDLGGNDVDFYQIQSGNCVHECIAISNVQPSQLLRLYVYDNTQNQIGFMQSPSNGSGFKYCTDFNIGTYYLQLLDANASSSHGHVTLSLSKSPLVTSPVITPGGPLNECQGDVVTFNSSSPSNNHWSNGQITQSVNDTILQAGYLSLQTDSSGCYSGFDSILITVNSGPTASFTSATNSYTISFANNSSGASTYQWYFGDGNSATQPTPTHTYVASGTYTVTLIAYNSCGQDTFTQTVNIIPNGISDNNFMQNISLYPNPANNTVNILMGGTAYNINIKIITTTGQVIDERKNLSCSVFTFDIADQAQGVYFVEIQQGDQLWRGKVVIAH